MYMYNVRVAGLSGPTMKVFCVHFPIQFHICFFKPQGTMKVCVYVAMVVVFFACIYPNTYIAPSHIKGVDLVIVSVPDPHVHLPERGSGDFRQISLSYRVRKLHKSLIPIHALFLIHVYRSRHWNRSAF